jgi:hypothetical protein
MWFNGTFEINRLLDDRELAGEPKEINKNVCTTWTDRLKDRRVIFFGRSFHTLECVLEKFN